jgi:surfactin synthase thioesterase subunit
MRVCLLQPPGRENRIREPIHPTHGAFAEDLVGFLDRGGYLSRSYSFIGHCGGVPLALETILRLEDLGLPLPRRLFASSWGAPHRGLYGPLMVVDVDTYDFEREVREQATRVGVPIPTDLAAIGARVLRADLIALLPWLYPATRFLPVPVTVLAWSRDEVVPPEQAVPGWEECAAVTSKVLDGDHLEFVQCPPALREVIACDLLVPE